MQRFSFFKTFSLVFLTLLLATGCANQALVHSYQGDVHVRTLQVDLAPIRDPEQSLNEEYSDLTKIIKGVQEVIDIFTPSQNQVLSNQLHTFESTLVKGIRSATSIPLKYSERSEVDLDYGDHNELRSIEFDYPYVEGAHLNIFATIYYTERSDLAMGMKEYNVNFIELRPEMILQVDGYTETGELFWRETVRYESDQMYKFGDQYVLGVPLGRLEESQLFLVPLAKEVVKKLAIPK